jgi:hypothetical protein
MKSNRKLAGFRPCNENSRDNDASSNYSGFYRIGMTNGITLIGKIHSEVEDTVYLLPHIVADELNMKTGDVANYRLEEEIPTEITAHTITFRQPVSDKYTKNFLEFTNGHDSKDDSKKDNVRLS